MSQVQETYGARVEVKVKLKAGLEAHGLLCHDCEFGLGLGFIRRRKKYLGWRNVVSFVRFLGCCSDNSSLFHTPGSVEREANWGGKEMLLDEVQKLPGTGRLGQNLETGTPRDRSCQDSGDYRLWTQGIPHWGWNAGQSFYPGAPSLVSKFYLD